MSRARSWWPIARRAALLVSAGSVSLGCSQALGLEGLTFEDPAADEEAAGVNMDAGVQQDANTDTSSTLPSGPLGPIAVDDSTYPRTIGKDNVLVGNPDPSHPSYVLYNPASAEVVVHDVDFGNNRFDAGEPWQWEPDWSLLMQVPRNDGSVLIGYDDESGLAEQIGIDEDGASTNDSERVAGSPGWTHFVPLEVDGIWDNVAYSSASGQFRFGPALVADAQKGEIVTGIWDAGFTSLVPLPIGDEVGILKYDAQTGAAEVEQLTGNAAEFGTTWSGGLGAGYDMVLTFADADGLLLLTYSGELGEVKTAWVSLTDELVVEYFDFSVWRTNLSQIHPLGSASSTHVVTYSAATGVAELRTVLPLESTSAAVK